MYTYLYIYTYLVQLFIILYTLFQLDTANIYWWWCINFCRVSGAPMSATCVDRLYHLSDHGD